MSKRLSLIVAGAVFALAAMGAQAADTSKPLSAQQQRMSDCNKQATGKSGDDRKAFMKSCLSGGATAPAKQTQQDKMKSCNVDAKAKALSGDARKQFMSDCLKNHA